MNPKSSEQLIRKSPEEYGEKYNEHLLEQYKLYIEMADKVSERRQSANNYFLTVNSLLVSLFGVISGFGIDIEQNIWWYFIPFAGLLVSITWVTLIRSYRQLNSGKFKVIHKLESQLPAALYYTEWKILEEGRGKQYLPFTHVEQFVPLIFALLYILLMIIAFMKDVPKC
ncbi:MAG: hypothetical protein KAT05_02405 [Spirochaetes bacterium]|nr:hypothetical protein [Spirochaetota bacterium]